MVALRTHACLAVLCAAIAFGDASTAQAAPDTSGFIAACVADPVVTDDPGLQDGSAVTPQIYCECVAGKFGAAGLEQVDVDMLVKLHKDEITDEDAESFPTLEELMQVNEEMEDDCKASLGMPTHDENMEEGPRAEEEMPEDQ